MNYFKVSMENGEHFNTGFNGTLQDAEEYYVDKFFNFGIEEDLMIKCTKVEE